MLHHLHHHFTLMISTLYSSSDLQSLHPKDIAFRITQKILAFYELIIVTTGNKVCIMLSLPVSVRLWWQHSGPDHTLTSSWGRWRTLFLQACWSGRQHLPQLSAMKLKHHSEVVTHQLLRIRWIRLKNLLTFFIHINTAIATLPGASSFLCKMQYKWYCSYIRDLILFLKNYVIKGVSSFWCFLACFMLHSTFEIKVTKSISNVWKYHNCISVV